MYIKCKAVALIMTLFLPAQTFITTLQVGHFKGLPRLIEMYNENITLLWQPHVMAG